MAVIKTEHLTYIYGAGTPYEKRALDDINLSIEAGEFVGVIGHTGSGKSTLIQHFNALLKPTSGKVYIDGVDVWAAGKAALRGFRFDVGLVFQYPEHQLFEETVYKDIAFGPRNMGLSEREIDERVREAAHYVGLTEAMLDRSPFEISGGQKRRAAIAGVLSMRPKVLILDEPTAGLDPRGRDQILRLIADYHRTTGSTVLIVSHSMEDVARYASRILIMNNAKVHAYLPVREAFSDPEVLMNMGLSVPPITRVFHRLSQKGLYSGPEVLTLEEGKAALKAMLGGAKDA
jgi:energy-coupling factor transport system ATP-binding protein